jgi:membrane protease YdiL (CAAX protease family)
MTAALAHLLAAYVVLAMPWVGRFKYRQLQRRIAAGIPDARLRFYLLTVVQQWSLISLVLVIAVYSSVPLRALGLGAPDSWSDTGGMLATFVVAIGISIVLFRYRGDRWLRRLLKMAGALIPSSARERRWFTGLALGAGVSEELLFRGFLLYYLGTYLPSLNLTQRLVISSLVFGFGHLYQGLLGVVATGLVGAVFGWLYVSTGSLVLPMAVHALVDLRLLAILTPKRLQSLQDSMAVASR